MQNMLPFFLHSKSFKKKKKKKKDIRWRSNHGRTNGGEKQPCDALGPQLAAPPGAPQGTVRDSFPSRSHCLVGRGCNNSSTWSSSTPQLTYFCMYYTPFSLLLFLLVVGVVGQESNQETEGFIESYLHIGMCFLVLRRKMLSTLFSFSNKYNSSID